MQISRLAITYRDDGSRRIEATFGEPYALTTAFDYAPGETPAGEPDLRDPGPELDAIRIALEPIVASILARAAAPA